MKMILTIIFRLTVSCLIAGTIMGMTFIVTNKAKKANDQARECFLEAINIFKKKKRKDISVS